MGQTCGDGGAAPVAVGAPRGVWPGCRQRQRLIDTQGARGGVGKRSRGPGGPALHSGPCLPWGETGGKGSGRRCAPRGTCEGSFTAPLDGAAQAHSGTEAAGEEGPGECPDEGPSVCPQAAVCLRCHRALPGLEQVRRGSDSTGQAPWSVPLAPGHCTQHLGWRPHGEGWRGCGVQASGTEARRGQQTEPLEKAGKQQEQLRPG